MAEDAVYATPLQGYGGSIIKLTDPTDELYKLELAYRGMVEDENGNLKQVNTPMMNEVGITRTIGKVQSIVNQMTMFSNIEDNHIMVLMEMLSDTLIRDLMINRKTYGIKDRTIRSDILFSAQSTAFLTLRRAWKGDDKRFWGRVQQDIRMENITSGGKKSLLPFNPFKRD